jgi:hypothetical protein
MKYSTIKILEMLGENPMLRFRNDAGVRAYLVCGVINFEGEVGIDDKSWEIERCQVDFIAAIKAYHNGSKIMCKYKNSEYIYSGDKNDDGRFTYLRDVKDTAISTEEILYGAWYIIGIQEECK